MISKKRGLSPIIATIMTIVMTVALVVVVWGIINNLIEGNIKSSESCFGNFERVTIGERYTCYNNDTKIVLFQISIRDIDVDGVLVSISGEGGNPSFTLTNEEQIISDLTNYSQSGTVKLPEKNSGTTYNYTWKQGGSATFMQIAPIINGNQCEVSDSLAIEFC